MLDPDRDRMRSRWQRFRTRVRLRTRLRQTVRRLRDDGGSRGIAEPEGTTPGPAEEIQSPQLVAGRILTVDEIDWRGVEFVDLGCWRGGSVRYCQRRFGASRGVGIDISERNVAEALEEGVEAAVGDGTRLALPTKVRFVSAMDFFEHLPDLSAVRASLASAARNASEFIYIRHPSFEGEEYLEGLGLRQYWWHWRGHRTHVRVSDYRRMFDELGFDQYAIRHIEPIEDSSHPSILPAGAPIDQHRYAAEEHGPKPEVSFETQLWRAQEIFVALRLIEPERWAQLTAPWGKDRELASVGG